jgi:hypothetical protein
MNGRGRCPDCAGGFFAGDGKCGQCNGTGINTQLDSDQPKCPFCRGSGVCQACGGSGLQQQFGGDSSTIQKLFE